MTWTVTIEGTVESFDTEAYIANLAALLGVDESDITLIVTASSVSVEATISMGSPDSAEAAIETLDALTPAVASATLGSTVLGTEVAVYQTRAVLAPSPPPRPPAASPPSRPRTRTAARRGRSIS